MKPFLTRVFAFALLLSGALQAQLAVRGERIHTMAGDPIENGVILIQGGKIQRIGPSDEISIPEGWQTLSAKIVTPGLIDAHSVVGLAGYLNQKHDQDQLERSKAIQPELRAIDAYNSKERLVEYLRGFGITTIHTGHGPGALVSGQTMIVKTIDAPVEEIALVPRAMIAATLAESGRGHDGKSPGTRAKQVSMLRSALLEAQDYQRKLAKAERDKPPKRDLRLEALVAVLTKEVPLLVTVHRAHDILTTLRLAEEFDLRIVLDGVAEAYLVLDRIRAAGVPVLIHPTMARSYGERENMSMETAARLQAAGIPFAMQSGFESYVPKTRVILFEAAIAAANGLSFEQALASITIQPARILGIADRVGSLAPGLDADLALFDGDPFEYTSHCTGVVINGRIESLGAR